MFGRPIACPSTNLLDQSSGDMTVTEHVKYTLSCLQHNLRQARLASQVYVGKMTKRTQEQAQSDHKYLLYDQVWVFKPHANLGLPRKLAPKYTGPFMIASVLPNNTYKLSKGLGEPTLKGTVSAQRLKPFYIKTANTSGAIAGRTSINGRDTRSKSRRGRQPVYYAQRFMHRGRKR